MKENEYFVEHIPAKICENISLFLALVPVVPWNQIFFKKSIKGDYVVGIPFGYHFFGHISHRIV